MRKIISIILCILLACNIGVFAVVAETPDGIVSISEVSVLPGDQVEVIFHLACENGVKTLSFFDFAFDSSVLSLVEPECQWLKDGKLHDIDFSKNTSIITFDDNVVLDDDLLKLVFLADENAVVGTVVPISCSVAATKMIDKVESEISVSLVPGSVEITDSTVSLSDFDYEITDNGIIITGYNGNATDLEIPDSFEIDGSSYEVVGIAESAFEGNESLKSVVIPATVEYVEDYAFYDCTSLTSITVLGPETQIGEEAFGYYYISRTKDGIVEGVTIYGYQESTAEVYADTEDKIAFVPLEEQHTHDYSVLQSDDFYHWYKCTNCDATTEKEAHSGGTATCTEKAKCYFCGKEYGNDLGHANGYDVTGKAATCKETGLTDGRYCPDCKTWLVEQEVIPVDSTNHVGYGTETRDYVAATCEANGYTGDTYCVGCGNKIGNGAVINKLAHDFTVLQSDATDHWYKCANCDATTEKVAHSGGTATCTAKAKCEVCDAEYGELADHDYSVLQSDATDHWYKCTGCDLTTETVAHSGGTATCTAKAKCEVCDAEYGELADHDYSVLQSDATDHWYKCANCDATTEKVAHSGGTATCTAKAKCEVCDAEYGKLADHDYSVLQSDATDHWYKCANCEATTEKEAHKGGTATCTAKAKCEVCDAEYGELADHDYSVLQSDATDHWYKCANCDATTEKAAHSGGTATCTAKAKCEVCDAEYGELADHDYSVLQSDATDHWYKCANCDATTEKAAHSGGTATCTAKAKCEVCDAEYGKLADHDYSVLQSDATDHWYKCANCDATTEKVAHSGGTATCTAKAKCEVCDAEYGDLADHDYSVLQSDATDHWYKCANCDATTEKAAHSGGTATCTAKAKCEVCVAEYGDLADHDYSVLQSDATDHWYKCANCDATTEKVAHSGGTATCTAKAKCEVCDVAYGIFNYTNHSTTETVTKNEKAAGYTFKGYTGDTYCAACDHLIASGTDIDNLTLADNETVKSANEILAAEEAAPGTYDAEQIAALEAALAELETLANDENENAVLTKIAEIGTMVTGLDPISYVTVTFTVDGEVVSTQTIRVGESATAPEQTEYINDGDNHKRFSGWTGDYTDVTEDITITATYETKDHVWVEGAVTKAATCMESGTQAQSCVCGATKTKPIEIDPTNHADYGMKVESAKAATCEEAGYTGDTVCIGCGEVITAGTSIDPLGHSFTNYVSDGNASCTEDGTKTAKCDRCDATDTITDEGSATGHVDADGDSICDDCGADVTPKNTCEYCGKVHEGFFGKIVQFFHNTFLKFRKFFGGFGDIHLHSYKSVITEPTCTEQGYTTHICKICGRTYTDNYTDALGHDFGKWITDVAPTCISEGHQYQKCSRCDAKNEKTIPVSSVHVDENNDGVCDLCGKTGVCSFCGRIHNGFLGGLVKGVHNVLHTIIRFFKK